MKLTEIDIQNLARVLNLCSIVEIDSVLIEDGMARAANHNHSAALIATADIPNAPGISIGFTRINDLRGRLGILLGGKNLTGTITVKDMGTAKLATMVEFTTSQSRLQYRCTSPSLIKAGPRENTDDPCKILTFDKETASLILSASKSMGAERAVLAIKGNDVVFEFQDKSNNDTFTVRGDGCIETIDGSPELANSVLLYMTDHLTAVIREAVNTGDTVTAVLGRVGTLSFFIGNYNLIILPILQRT